MSAHDPTINRQRQYKNSLNLPGNLGSTGFLPLLKILAEQPDKLHGYGVTLTELFFLFGPFQGPFFDLFEILPMLLLQSYTKVGSDVQCLLEQLGGLSHGMVPCACLSMHLDFFPPANAEGWEISVFNLKT